MMTHTHTHTHTLLICNHATSGSSSSSSCLRSSCSAYLARWDLYLNKTVRATANSTINAAMLHGMIITSGKRQDENKLMISHK